MAKRLVWLGLLGRRGRIKRSAALGLVIAAGLGWLPPARAAASVPGTILWTSRYKGPSGGADVATSLRVSPDGTLVFVTGSSGGTTTRLDYATVAYDAGTGARLWARRYNGSASSDDAAHSLGVSPVGNAVFVTGTSDGGRTSGFDYATVAYDAGTGARLWARRYNGRGSGDEFATSLAASPNGTAVFVTGSSDGGRTRGSDFATVAYDASSGSRLWVRRYNGSPRGGDGATAIGVSPDGTTVFVTGSSAPGDYATLAYDAGTGARLWSRRYNGPKNGFDGAIAIEVSPDGTAIFVSGSSEGRLYRDYATVAYDAGTGARLWARRYNGQANMDDLNTALAVSPNGSAVFVTGYSIRTLARRYDYTTVAYDADTGARLWVRSYNSPVDVFDFPSSLGVSPDASAVYVTGSGGGDYATVAYDAGTGARLWVRRYGTQASGGDAAGALGVSPDGTAVFVTGGVGRRRNHPPDYATLAYAA
jgi:outer membrane protein assembly factor BamB